ncbi:MAG: gliding motility-associated C-terminal domain-containing protein [Cyclobacteriaceae bacterium]|nr:gliding motility-associated C-terminal domain-containing protein [Cyclobacteriaceae bacterium]
MNLKYRLLLAVFFTLLALGYQVAFSQTKKAEKNFIIQNNATCNCGISVTPVITNVSACNQQNGGIQITVSGGSGSFSFQWRNQSGAPLTTTQNLTGIGTGYYFLEIRDINAPSCGVYYYNYTLSTSLSIAAVIKDNIGCVTANGAITPTVNGGSGSYTYVWKYPDGSEVTTKDIVNVKAGSYYLTATDVTLGCIVSRSFNIKSTSSLLVSQLATTPNTSCVVNNGSIDVMITNGSGQYSSYWYNLQTYGIASSTEDLTNSKGGNYSLFSSDLISGCTAYQSFTIEEQTKAPEFTISDITPNTVCQGQFNGAVNLQPFGTPGPYEITWTDGIKTVSTLEDPTTLASGKHGFTIRDTQTKCTTVIPVTHSQAVDIPNNSLPTINITQNELKPNTGCSSPNGEIAVTISDPQTPYSFSWTGPNGFTSVSEDITNLAPGTYTLKVEAGCNTPPAIIANDLSAKTQSAIAINLLDIVSDSENNLDLSTIEIVEAPLSKAKASINASYMLEVDYTGIKFTGSDHLRIRACDVLNECTESLITIAVALGDVIVYNAVAPNGVGNNKFMRIENLPEGNKVSVFNRWGDKVFETRNYDNLSKKFDGISLDGKMLPNGTYFYKIEFQNSHEQLNGYVVLKWL